MYKPIKTVALHVNLFSIVYSPDSCGDFVVSMDARPPTSFACLEL